MYARYGRHLLRRNFASINVGGARWPDASRPTIALLNHSAWWDPIIALHLSHDLFRRDGYGIMQGSQLERYPFFQRIGCFGATAATLQETRAVAALATTLLRERSNRTLWLFPQGELLPARTTIRFRSGAARIALGTPHVLVVPVALRYEMRHHQRPEIHVRVGESIEPGGESPATLTQHLAHALRRELARLDEDLNANSTTAYRPTLLGRASIATLYEKSFGALRQRWRMNTAPDLD
jgi:1-acyl-sn-glycerol-3-phosphate acyltransferase